MYRILIIDDKEVFRRKLQRLSYFQQQKDRVRICYTAQNGQEGLEILEREQVDIVITDIRMPIMGGLELLRIIHERKLCPCTILLSEYSEFSYAKAGIVYGAFDYVVKPITNENISAVIDRAIDWLGSVAHNKAETFPAIEDIISRLITGTGDLPASIRALQDELDLAAKSAPAYRELARQVESRIYSLVTERKPEITSYLLHKQFPESEYGNLAPHEFWAVCAAQIKHWDSIMTQFRTTSASSVIQKVCEYVLTHIEEDLNLQDISERFYVSKKYLSTQFKRETGIRFIEYLTRAKIQRAKVLLQEPDAKVYLVAARLGYADTEYFSRVFKNETGCTPSKYCEKESL